VIEAGVAVSAAPDRAPRPIRCTPRISDLARAWVRPTGPGQCPPTRAAGGPRRGLV